MTTEFIIEQLDDLGISIASNGKELSLKPGSRVPKQLLDRIRMHKSDLLNHLPIRLPLDSELSEIVRHVRENGYALLWSNVLQDTVAFTESFQDANQVPVPFIIYTLDELVEVFGSETPSVGSLRRIHLAKKHGGRIIDDK
jgi:hypothetical protein